MIKVPAPNIRGFFWLSRLRRTALAVIFLATLVFGYQTPAAAEGPVAPPSVCAACPGGSCPCDPPGTTAILQKIVSAVLDKLISKALSAIEDAFKKNTDDMVESLLTSINDTELKMIAWWENMWRNKLLPAMQAMTRQLNTALADQSRTVQSVIDAGNLAENLLTRQEDEIEDHRMFRPDDKNGCPPATTAGGYGRATAFSNAMRNGWEKESVAIGLNKKDTPGAASAIDAERRRYDDYRENFCDPDGNGGENDCGASDPAYYNADTLPSKFIYNRLTTDVTEPKMAKAVETIINNMVGVPSADPISRDALKSASGQETFLARRAYLARYAAIRSVPQLIAGWRMPGSHMGDFVKSLREGAGVPLAGISANPSYREILHASSIDRFNSGAYAIGLVTDEGNIEMEKLTLNVFYLMQLRDYYELLERTALALAVQVSLMADQAPMPDVVSVTPLR